MEVPYPLPPEQRILYISTVPRADAGAEEAFFIRLLQAQIDHFHISVVTASGESETDRDRLANAIENTWKLRDSLREKLKPRLLEEQKKSEEFKEIAQAQVKNLSGIPLYLRGDELRNNQLFINGKADLAGNLQAKQEQAVTEGLERFQTRKPLIRLTLTAEDLKDLGVEVEQGEIVGEVDPERLAAKVGSLIKGFDLVRVRGSNNSSPEELEQKYLVGKPASAEDRANTRKR
jgi:transcriptional regulator of heat shock response